jgi:cell division protein FtsQ
MAAAKRATVRAVAPVQRRRSPFGRVALPSGRWILVAFGLLALGAGAYAAALKTSVFAVQRIEVVGGSALTRAAVQNALGPELGRSLMRVNAAEVERRVAPVTTVFSVRLDREFPHTLKIRIRPERPVLLLRQGADGWVVSAHGRVLSKVKNVRLSSLPRTYIPRNVSIQIGARLAPDGGGLAATALAPLLGTTMLGRVRFVTADERELTLSLRSGVQVRLGAPADLRLKFAITRRVLASIGPDTTHGYVDVSVPQWPVYGQ